MAEHYETLGVAPRARAEEIRAAYLALARMHHPDRHGDSPPAARAAAARRMRELNAAWAVLSDPTARQRYDATLGVADAPTPPRAPGARAPVHPDVEHLDEGDTVGRFHPARWLPLTLVLFVLGCIVVFTAFAASSNSPSSGSGSLGPGSCVRVSPALASVSCAGGHDAVVVSLAAFPRTCPVEQVSVRIDSRQVACLRPTP